MSKPVLSTLQSVCLIIGITLFCIQYFTSYYFAQFYSTPEAEYVLKLLAISYIIESFNVIPLAKLAKKMDFKKLALIDLLSSIVMPIVVLICAYNDMGYWSIAFGHLSYGLARFVIIKLLAPYTLPYLFKIKRIFPIMKFGLQNTASSLINQINTSLDTIIGGFFIPTTQLGIYQVGLQISLIPLRKISPELRRISFPAYSKINDKMDKVAEYYLKSSRLICILIFPLFWGLGLVAEELIILALTDKWIDSVIIIQILCFALPFKLLDEISCSMLNAIGRADMILAKSILTTVVFIIAIASFIELGIKGLALSWLVSILVPFIVIIVQITKVLPLTLINIFRSIAPSLFGCIIMSSAIFLLKFNVNTTPTMLLIYSLFAGVTTYTCYCLLLHKQLLFEIKGLFNK
jgi:O-antigen/teichoic acid export membrane protein